MTTERKVLRLDESKIVVVRRVPITEDTSNKLRELREHFQNQYYNDHGIDIEMPFPVVIDKIINETHALVLIGK